MTSCSQDCQCPQVAGFLAVVPGAVLGIIVWRQLGDESSELTAHAAIGIIVLAFVVLQVLAAVWRPKPDTKLRYSSRLKCPKVSADRRLLWQFSGLSSCVQTHDLRKALTQHQALKHRQPAGSDVKACFL